MRSHRESVGEPGRDRKDEHLEFALEPGVTHSCGSGLGQLRLRHRALPERDLDRVTLETTFLGTRLGAPLLVSSMTGGTGRAKLVNDRLAAAAAASAIAMGVGSGRRLLDDPGLLPTYQPADRPPLWLANLGATQLVRPGGEASARHLVELLDADGLVVHLNGLQEAIQPEGETNFSGVLDSIARAVELLRPVPVIVKEVGFGMDVQDVRLLNEAGVAAVDIAGAGGTNWALVEGRREATAARVAAPFHDWGTSTVDAVCAAREAAPELPLVASGGLKHGVDIAKVLALGADLAGMARPLLAAAMDGRVDDELDIILRQLRVATWSVGVGSVSELDTRCLVGR